MTHSNIAKIEETILSLLPDEDYRRACLSLFVESLLEANSYGRNKWGVYCYSEGVRLLVGSLIVCTVHKNGLWLSLDKQLLNEMKDKQDILEECKAWHWDNGDWSEYKKIPSKNGYYIPSSRDLDIWPLLRDLHFEYIKKAANKYDLLRIDSQKKHSPELLVYLSNELDQSIPRPDYGDKPENNALKDFEECKDTYEDLPKTQRESIILSRIGQGAFRSGLVNYWGTCAVTGCSLTRLLRASHIKPWRDSDNAERLDIYNGLLLIPNLDSAFDLGYISFDNEGKIIISDKLSENDRNELGIHPGMNLRNIEKNHVRYLNYHRREIFRDT
ncbi:HNH endonuclease [Methanoculleus sp. UBA430]|nr:HNH endonuclease [Methanoculleus sp. UBA430]